ncbi:TetR/AcrR family transcriptional regulator [Mucilaginibacter ginsenosidivorans]|uniref:TetR/AcrR family transcriptional regulator n=1 Tax=Mucilaginibacter ginsenosidivorans TaxID=398053 RepID=A0A5B8UVA7_9SPHI|nr:TetR/AcrR family transcriptional regulator [Mucilaginibacter ginsenosidivorans]QEC62839.1 TetR/AcrR family transcriptional regulator [Mucilaginibacter ginsenosidivorans]
MARNREFETDEVLDKAIDLFWNKGYNGVSTQEMINEFGISKSSMYGAFGDKMELFILALERYRGRLYNEANEELENGRDVKAQIDLMLKNIVKKALADSRHKGCFVVNSCIELARHNEQVAKIVTEHQQNMEELFTKAIQRGIKTGDIPSGKNAKALSRTICNTISGIEVDARYIRAKQHFADIIDNVMELLN